ncbi:PREDICTED: thymic stromal cotransporter homolog [Nanorana parkeri]|uniref:thymic stromal cotransporter homolog n=1 Tax=Nanorana parkeri TaxID=125878 RepID=UPI000854257A|nr:PREDICTED: thymic stromal cotransporter homolog [Nanorana parkeri]
MHVVRERAARTWKLQPASDDFAEEDGGNQVQCSAIITMRTWIEPVVAGAQVASSFYDTALLFVVKNYYNRTTTSLNTSHSVTLQKAISNFYIIHNLILGLTPLLSAYILARIGDRQRRKVTICVPLLGYFISRCFLLPVLFLDWPIEVMFGSAALNGLTGWFTTYWAGVMAWAALDSTKKRRSLKFIIIELVYGLSGCVGSLASGHIFVSVTISNDPGATLVICSVSLYFLCLIYSLFILKVPYDETERYGNSGEGVDAEEVSHENSPEPTERSKLLGEINRPFEDLPPQTPAKLFIALLFATAILYNISVDGGMDVLNLFLIKEPLGFSPTFIGYASAAGYLIFITSFLGVWIFSRCLKDVTLIIMGIVSFCAGIFIMASVRWTFLYFVARAVMMFALIPMPTIRSVLSKHIQGSSYGKVFVVLQLSIAITGVLTSIAFNKIYQATLTSFSGACFIISGILSILSIIPIR